MIEQQAKDWLKKQAIWQIYLPAPRYIPHPKFDVSKSNKVHQADLLFLPHDRVGWTTFRYALTVVAVASRYKEAEPLTSKTLAEVADALSRIYRRGPLKCANLLQVDPGREFMGAVSQVLAKHGVEVRRGRVDIHRDQGVGERFNRTLAERLFGHQYAQEMRLPEGARSTEWVKRLPAVVATLNSENTRLTGKKTRDAIRDGRVSLTLCCFVVYSTRRFVVCLSVCHFVLVFFSPFSTAITSLAEERANHSAFRTFVRFVLV